MSFSFAPDNQKILRLLKYPQGRIDMVLDTDMGNEIDDQFALVYALKSCERLHVEAVYAAPFTNERVSGPAEGMEMSYLEILRFLKLTGVESAGFAFKGSEHYLGGLDHPVESDAAKDLAERAMRHTPEHPLYVVGIGAITNVSSAILMRPEIIDRIVVVWLGGNPEHWNSTKEFNLEQDILSSRLLFDSGVALVHVPCRGVSSHLFTSLPELEACIGGKNAVCDALVELFRSYRKDHFGWAKEIWDIATIAYLINSDWVPTTLIHSPILNDGFTWSFDSRRHFIRNAVIVDRNAIFVDMFAKLCS